MSVSRDTRLTVARSENLAAVVARVLSSKTARVVLTIPSGALIGTVAENFRLLCREAEAAGIVIGIESIDDHILALASAAGIPAANPVFRARERSMSDIIARPSSATAGRSMREAPENTGKLDRVSSSRALRNEKKKVRPSADAAAVPVAVLPLRRRDEQSSEKGNASVVPEEDADEDSGRPTRRRRFAIGGLVAAAVLVVVWWMGGAVMSRATVEGVIIRVAAPFEEQVRIMVSQTMPDITGPVITLPGQSFDARKNIEMTFTAAGRLRTETKASGTLVITNAYSSEPQVLVATTRFISPEGALFRLASRTVIPGARIEGGSIRPASTTVHVVADEAGDRFNVPASSGWKIPGFEGTPKYHAFLVAAPLPFRGGFVGEMPMPTDEERASATAAVDAALKSALETELSLVRTDRLVRPPDATKFAVVRREFSPGDEPGTFRIFAEATLSELVFDEQMLTDALVTRALELQDLPLSFDDAVLSYATSTSDVSSSTHAMQVSGTLTFRRQFDTDGFLRELAGQAPGAFPEILARHPELDTATLSLSPFWAWKVPDDSTRIVFSLR